MNEALRARIVTALVLAVLLFGVVLGLPPMATLVLLTLVILAGAWEWSAFLRAESRAVRPLFVALVAVSLPIAWELTEDLRSLQVAMSVTMLWWLGAFVWILAAPQSASRWAAAGAGLMVLVPTWVAIARMRMDVHDGAWWVIFTVVVVVAADTGAYFAGRRFGRVRLAPRVSPGKTWEGVIGGVVLASLVAVGIAVPKGLELALLMPWVLGVVAFSIVGDLTESLLKRRTGVKDSGRLFPGHGGVLDRIDSLTAGAPLMLIALIQLGFHR